MYLVSRIDYTRLQELRYAIYGLLIASLVVTLGIAGATRGAKAWIELPFFQLQPSEFGKVLLVVALVGLRRRAGCGSWAARRRRGSSCWA